jgi:predicted nucleotidyltransferase
MRNKELKQMTALIVRDLDPKRIILFGSRSKGMFHKSSDYDLAVDSKKISFRRKRKLLEQIEEIMGLHSFDLIILSQVDPKFRKIILNSGTIIYER